MPETTAFEDEVAAQIDQSKVDAAVDTVLMQFDESNNLALDVLGELINQQLSQLWRAATTSYILAYFPGNDSADITDLFEKAGDFARESLTTAINTICDAKAEQLTEVLADHAAALANEAE